MSKAKKAPAKKGGDDDDVDYNDNLRQNYKKACTALGIQPHPSISKALSNDEDPTAPILEVCTDSEIGTAGVRAFCAALLGKGIGMKATGYKHIKSLRFWRSGCGDAGVAAVAEVLRNGKDEVAPTFVEFMDCGVGPEGCAAMGAALMLGANASLETLRLDLNPGIGDAGLIQLCRGLRTNRTLRTLTLGYCNIGPAGAAAIAAVLGSSLSALEKINLMGNSLGSEGLHILAQAAARSKTLLQLNLRDNGIGSGTLISHVAMRPPPMLHSSAAGGAGDAHAGGAAAGAGGDSAGAGGASAGGHGTAAAGGVGRPPIMASAVGPGPFASSAAGSATGLALPSMGAAFEAALEDAATSAVASSKGALEELGRVLADAAVPLNSVDLEMNGLTAEEAAVLVPYMTGNTKVQVLKVDTSLPSEIFAVLCRSGVASKGGKKKKGAGGKKKKK